MDKWNVVVTDQNNWEGVLGAGSVGNVSATFVSLEKVLRYFNFEI